MSSAALRNSSFFQELCFQLNKPKSMQFIIFAVSFLISAIVTPVIRNVAVNRGWISTPASERHLHIRPTPRLGGVVIFLTLWTIVLAALCILPRLGPNTTSLHPTLLILGPASLVFFLGLVDDFRELNAYFKFAVQAVAAVWLYGNGFGITALSTIPAAHHFGWLIGLPLTILWVLLITNAFNLIDGLDGLAAGSALFSTLVICVVALLNHNELILVLTLALAGAIAGLLRYNFNPATIFLGDCGSLFIGFLLSAIALAGSQKSPTMVAVAIPIVSFGLPILDVTIAVIRRFLSGKKLFSPDSEHIHHRLMSRGIPHRQAVLLLYGVSAGFALLSLFLLSPGGETIGMVLLVVGIGVLIGIQQLRYHEFFELGRLANRTLNQRQIIANNLRIRRAVDSLNKCEEIPELCRILQGCLEQSGFDGFSLFLDTFIKEKAELYPLNVTRRGGLEFFWDDDEHSEANWSVSFGLITDDFNHKGRFTLHRRVNKPPILLDVNIITSSGFSTALATCISRIMAVRSTHTATELLHSATMAASAGAD